MTHAKVAPHEMQAVSEDRFLHVEAVSDDTYITAQKVDEPEMMFGCAVSDEKGVFAQQVEVNGSRILLKGEELEPKL